MKKNGKEKRKEDKDDQRDAGNGKILGNHARRGTG